MTYPLTHRKTSRDSDNDSLPDRSLAWDSRGIDLTSLGSTSPKSSFESSGETAESIEKVSNKGNPIDYRHVWIPMEELGDSPFLNWTRVRPS